MGDLPDSVTDAQADFLNAHDGTTEEIASRLGVTESTLSDHRSNCREAGVTFSKDSEGVWSWSTDNAESDDTPTVTDSTTGEPSAADLPDSFVNSLRDNGLTYKEMEQQYDWSKEQAQRVLDKMSESGWAIEFDTLDAQGTRQWYIPDARDKRYQIGDGDGTYRFGLISDTHLGSKAAHLADLHDFYDKMQERGVDLVLHAGDITDGWEVHRNQINEVHSAATGWKRMREYCVEHYPQREGIETLFISGNHDRKLWRREGIRLSRMIANRREDLHWLGDSMARLVFDPEHNFDLELIHPSGGQPYTLGYRAQTLYREQPTDVRPSMTGIGHLHGRMQAAAEGVEAFYTGCWKDLTTYGRRKGHAAEIGGWDVEITISDGELNRLVTSWEKYPAHADTRGDADLPNIQEFVSDGLSADADGSTGLFDS